LGPDVVLASGGGRYGDPDELSTRDRRPGLRRPMGMTDPQGDLRLGGQPVPPGRPARRPVPVGLRPISELPSRARLFLIAAGLTIAGFTAFVAVRLYDTDGRALAVLLIVLCCLGAFVIAIAVVTATRILFSLRAMPYLLGRGARRLLTRRRR
jgi:hypothetical protein